MRGKTLGVRKYGLVFIALQVRCCIFDRHPTGNVPEKAGWWNEMFIVASYDKPYAVHMKISPSRSVFKQRKLNRDRNVTTPPIHVENTSEGGLKVWRSTVPRRNWIHVESTVRVPVASGGECFGVLEISVKLFGVES